MNMGEAMAWLALNPRPIIEPDESPFTHTERFEEWIFRYSLACEAIGDEKRDAR